MTRKRAISDVINEQSQDNRSTASRTVRKARSKVRCYCINCKGDFVDPRTKILHEAKSSSEKVTTDHYLHMIQEDEVELEGIYIPEPSTSAFRQLDLVQQNTQDSKDIQDIQNTQDSEDIQDIQDTQENETADDDKSYDEPKLTFLPRRRVKRHVNR